MYENNSATLKMKKVLKKGMKLSAYSYEGIVRKYEEERECIYLSVSCALTKISLDAIYECKIKGDKREIALTGRVVERYVNEEGNILKLHIETGFYKNNAK